MDEPKKPLSATLHFTLKLLSQDDFEAFMLYLKDSGVIGEKFKTIPECYLEKQTRPEVTKVMMKTYGLFTIDIMKNVLKAIPHNKALDNLNEYPYDRKGILADQKESLRSTLKQKCQFLVESLSETKLPFNEGYTEQLVTEAYTGQINDEHEVTQIEIFSRPSAQEEKTRLCQDLFEGLTKSGEQIRRVLTKGVAGVGKTVLTLKFSLDWAEGKSNQDIELLFLLPFREINVHKDTKYSLMELLHRCFRLSKEVFSLQYLQVLFILDGLDEFRLPLDFMNTRELTDPTESASVGELLVNLIRGDLLPSALVWITTRPAAANQIPPECVSRVTEVRGFNDEQKEDYFRKRFKDNATDVLKHIRSIRSLFIMCFIPVFCFIVSNVLKTILEQTQELELPTTLTQMFAHFLVVQAKFKNIKYKGGSGDVHWTEKAKEMVWSLGKLAFKHLMKDEEELIFYESDLKECDLEPTEIAQSGLFKEVFKEESGQYKIKVYSFIHLTMHEFMAALQVHETFFSSGVNLLFPEKKNMSVEEFYRSAIDLAYQSPNGHLDMFVRFLLGLSVPTNQKLLKDLLTQTGSDQTNKETVYYIKEKLNVKDQSVEKKLNLIHCMNELNDYDMLEQIQRDMKGGYLFWVVSPSHWSALSFVLLSSDSDLQEFDLRKYQVSEESFQGLLPVLKVSTKATVRGCLLTEWICPPLASVLSSSLSLKLLDLSNNDLGDSGVMLLCEGLKRDSCRLETLRLSGCLVSEVGGACLAAALSSASSALTELDLSFNNPGRSADLLKKLKEKPEYVLNTLRLDPAGEQWMVPGLRKYYCEFSLDPKTAERSLCLSEDNRTVWRPKRGEEEEEEEEEDQQNQPDPDDDQRLCLEQLQFMKLQEAFQFLDLFQELQGPDDEQRFLEEPEVLMKAPDDEQRFLEEPQVLMKGPDDEQRFLEEPQVLMKGPDDEQKFLEQPQVLMKGPDDEQRFVEQPQVLMEGPDDEQRFLEEPQVLMEGPDDEQRFLEEPQVLVKGPDDEQRFLEEPQVLMEGPDDEQRFLEEPEVLMEGPDDEQRFREEPQVLSSTGLQGRYYWEVKLRKSSREEWMSEGVVDIAVSLNSMNRRGQGSRFGDDDQSWSLRVRSQRYHVRHNNTTTNVSFPFSVEFVSVLLDSEAETLSFYGVSKDKVIHLHTITSPSFSQPLFPGFRLEEGESVTVLTKRESEEREERERVESEEKERGEREREERDGEEIEGERKSEEREREGESEKRESEERKSEERKSEETESEERGKRTERRWSYCCIL